MTAALATLNSAAQVTLADCELRIERGLKSFIDVGEALATIHNGRLYRATHATFEEYCRHRWNLSRPRAYELMSAAETVSGMPDTAAPVTSARQASALAKVPEAERAEVWREANERTGGKPTAKAVKEVAKERKPLGPKPTPEVEPPDEDLIAAVVAALADAGPFGRSVAEIWSKTSVHSSRVAAAIEVLVEQGRVTEVEAANGSTRWMLAPTAPGPVEVDEAPSAVPGPTPEPGRHLHAVPDPAAPKSQFALTPDQRRQIAEDGERTLAIENARRKASSLVRDVAAAITEIELGAAYGEPGLITAEIVAGLRAEADRLESYMEAQA